MENQKSKMKECGRAETMNAGADAGVPVSTSPKADFSELIRFIGKERP